VTRPEGLRHHGDEVLVFDAKGNYECRGVIVGVHRCEPPHYDIQPNRQESLSRRICGIPESRLRSVGKAILAYERRPLPEAKHILDDA
jgi:hypothetical protein